MNQSDKLLSLAQRAIPFLRDEGAKYEDDGSNEPLELAREIEAVLASEPSQGGEAYRLDPYWDHLVPDKATPAEPSDSGEIEAALAIVRKVAAFNGGLIADDLRKVENVLASIARANDQPSTVFGKLVVNDHSVDLCPIAAGKLPDSRIRQLLGNGIFDLVVSRAAPHRHNNASASEELSTKEVLVPCDCGCGRSCCAHCGTDLGFVQPQRQGLAVQVECRECSDCGHIGINDLRGDEAACADCCWRGESPVEDKCPDCGHTNCMMGVCPKCESGSYYRLIAEATLTQPASAAVAEQYVWLCDNLQTVADLIRANQYTTPQRCVESLMPVDQAYVSRLAAAPDRAKGGA